MIYVKDIHLVYMVQIICNAYLNGIPRLTKSELASQSVDTLLNHGQECGKVKTHHNNFVFSVENFEN